MKCFIVRINDVDRRVESAEGHRLDLICRVDPVDEIFILMLTAPPHDEEGKMLWIEWSRIWLVVLHDSAANG